STAPARQTRSRGAARIPTAMRILVLNADSLHLGYIGCYGCEWVPTPNLDRLAAEGIVFDQHFADCPKARHPTDAMHRSAWTGCPGPPFASSGVPEAPLLDLLKRRNVTAVPVELSDWKPKRLAPALDLVGSHDPVLVWLDLPTLATPWSVSREQFEAF